MSILQAITLFLLLVGLPVEAQTERAVPVAQAVIKYFPVEARQTALCTAFYENQTFDPWAVSPTGDYGVMQINLKTHRARIIRLDANVFEVDDNVRVAADIWAEQGWRPWSTRWRCER